MEEEATTYTPAEMQSDGVTESGKEPPPPLILERFWAMVREREEELRVTVGADANIDLGGDDIVRIYEILMSELSMYSEPMITDLTTVAGEQIMHGAGIADAICSRFIEVPVEHKLSSLYLIDSIVKDIGREYVEYFSARLPEVFFKAYGQVHPNLYPEMRRLFDTWSTVFPAPVLQKIESCLEFSPSVNHQSSGLPPVRSSESPCPTNGIHMNPDFTEASQQFGQAMSDANFQYSTVAPSSSEIYAHRPPIGEEFNSDDMDIDTSQAGSANMTSSVSAAKVSAASATPKSSFKIGECIRRVASQLTGSASFKSNSDQPGDDVSQQMSEGTQRGSMVVATRLSSLDEMLLQLKLAAQNPREGHNILNNSVSFFSSFRSSVISDRRPNSVVGRQGSGKRRKSSQTAVGATEEFEFDDINDSYWTNRIVQNYSKEQLLTNGQNEGGNNQLVAYDPNRSVEPIRRSRKRYSTGNYEKVGEEFNEHERKKRAMSPAELIMSFTEGYLPSEMNLNKIFRRFGTLKEAETEVDYVSRRAKVVFKRGSDAEIAYSSAGVFNIFGSAQVTYQLSYSPSSIVYKPLLPAATDPISVEAYQHLQLSTTTDPNSVEVYTPLPPAADSNIFEAYKPSPPNTDPNLVEVTVTDPNLVEAYRPSPPVTESNFVEAYEHSQPGSDSTLVEAYEPSQPGADSNFVKAYEPSPPPPVTDSNLVEALESSPPATDSNFVKAYEPSAPATDSNFVEAFEPSPPRIDPNFVEEYEPPPPEADPNLEEAHEPSPPETDPKLVEAHEPSSPETDPKLVETYKPSPPGTDLKLVEAHKPSPPETDPNLVEVHKTSPPETDANFMEAYEPSPPPLAADPNLVEAHKPSPSETDPNFVDAFEPSPPPLAATPNLVEAHETAPPEADPDFVKAYETSPPPLVADPNLVEAHEPTPPEADPNFVGAYETSPPPLAADPNLVKAHEPTPPEADPNFVEAYEPSPPPLAAEPNLVEAHKPTPPEADPNFVEAYEPSPPPLAAHPNLVEAHKSLHPETNQNFDESYESLAPATDANLAEAPPATESNLMEAT